MRSLLAICCTTAVLLLSLFGENTAFSADKSLPEDSSLAKTLEAIRQYEKDIDQTNGPTHGDIVLEYSSKGEDKSTKIESLVRTVESISAYAEDKNITFGEALREIYEDEKHDIRSRNFQVLVFGLVILVFGLAILLPTLIILSDYKQKRKDKAKGKGKEPSPKPKPTEQQKMDELEKHLSECKTKISELQTQLNNVTQFNAELKSKNEALQRIKITEKKFSKVKRSFAQKYHPNNVNSEGIDRLVREEIFKEFWEEIRNIEDEE